MVQGLLIIYSWALWVFSVFVDSLYLSMLPLLLRSCMLYVCPYFSAAVIDPLLCFDSDLSLVPLLPAWLPWNMSHVSNPLICSLCINSPPPSFAELSAVLLCMSSCVDFICLAFKLLFGLYNFVYWTFKWLAFVYWNCSSLFLGPLTKSPVRVMTTD